MILDCLRSCCSISLIRFLISTSRWHMVATTSSSARCYFSMSKSTSYTRVEAH
jgi:hypothetical protein